MKNERYYYSALTKDEKSAYRMIYNGIKEKAWSITLLIHLPLHRIQEIYLDVLYDNPLFYYVNQTVIRISGHSGGFVLLPEYLYTNSEIAKLNQDIGNVLRRIDVKARTMLDNEFRLEKYLHDSVVKSVAYDYDSLSRNDCYNAHSIIGALLDKRAVCEGIAKAFKLLCNTYSMKCIVVLGKADQSGVYDDNSYHAWNLVKVGNGSYHVDVTWDNMFDREFEHISYDYFNVTTQDILKDHRPIGKLPLCTDTGLNYFCCTKSYIGSYEELVTLIAQRFNAKSIMFRIRENSYGFESVEEIRSNIFSALSQVVNQKGCAKEAAVLINKPQRIGKILFREGK